MNRPGSWDPLWDADPCPGSLTDIQNLARRWSQNWEAFAGANTTLTGTLLAGAGSSVDAARLMLQKDAALLAVYRDDSENNSNLLSSWAVAVERLQGERDPLLNKARQAQDEERGAMAVLMTPMPAVPLTAPLSDPLATERSKARQQLEDARGILARCRADAAELRSNYLAEATKHAAGYRVTPMSKAAPTAGIGADEPIGTGALASLLGASKELAFTQLNELKSYADGGDVVARQSYLALLACLSVDQIARYGAMNPFAVRNPLPDKNPETTKFWWAGLSPEQRAALAVALPGVIGNLNGVPYAARAKANLANLSALDGDPATSQKLKDEIATIRKNLTPDKSGADRFLISLDINRGKPLAAVAIGDLDTARNVTWNVPGMSTTVGNGLDSWTQSAQDLYNGQQKVFDSKQQNPGTAIVSWLGYETPDAPPESLGVTGSGMALAGADRLALALDGFSVVREGGPVPARLNVVAHSYGSTTAAYALTKTSYPVDNVAFFGSAGIDRKIIPDSSALNVASTAGEPNVYVTKASGDRVANVGIAGSILFDPLTGTGRANPTGAWFGAHVFSSEGGYNQDGTVLHRTDGHDAKGARAEPGPLYATVGHGYLDSGTESAKNIALASTGNGAEIQPLRPLLRNPDGSYDETPQPALTNPGGSR